MSAEASTTAIVTDPYDETVRVVYADWLDERGGVGRQWLSDIVF
jgi:uncharacterized protein (TIGR02996 family)